MDKEQHLIILKKHLAKLLEGAEVEFVQDQGVLNILGKISEEKRLHIEFTVKELEEIEN